MRYDGLNIRGSKTGVFGDVQLAVNQRLNAHQKNKNEVESGRGNLQGEHVLRAERVARTLKSKNLSLRELGRKCGVSHPTILEAMKIEGSRLGPRAAWKIDEFLRIRHGPKRIRKIKRVFIPAAWA